MDKDEKDSGFKVVDRRSFDDSGAPREGAASVAAAEERPAEAAPTASAASEPPRTAPDDGAAAGARRGSMQQLSFGHFCLSLAGSTQVALGLIPNPQTNLTTKDLGAARQTIDLLSMLQEKTKGNLTPEESGLLEELLYTLRMQYIEVTKPTPARP